ncbi:MAG: glycosyltransferase family 2 protein [Thiohalomonadales bacterium]
MKQMTKHGTKQLPLVSVVIPSYNGADTLRETIDSVLSQSYSRLEILVVNDGSTDNTKEVLAAYKNRITCLDKQNGGLASARNFGMKHAKGDYIVWLDADDIMEVDKITIQLHVMENNSDVVLTCTDFSAFNKTHIFDQSHIKQYYSSITREKDGFDGIYNKKNIISFQKIEKLKNKNIEDITVYYGDIYNSLIWGNVVHPPTVMFRRSASEQLNGLDSNLGEGTDYEYFIRFSRLGKIGYINWPLLRYRYSEKQMSADVNLGSISASTSRVLEKIAKENPSYIEEHKYRFTNRLSRAYISAARHNAGKHRKQSLKFLWKAINLGYYKSDIAVITVMALMPKSLLSLLRRIRMMMKRNT